MRQFECYPSGLVAVGTVVRIGRRMYLHPDDFFAAAANPAHVEGLTLIDHGDDVPVAFESPPFETRRDETEGTT